MKHDSTKYNDREIRLIGMTANHTSRPDKVLFFADPHFLLNAYAHCTHCQSPTSRPSNQNLPKSAILPPLQKEILKKYLYA